MKRILLILLLIYSVTVSTAFGVVVYWEPENPVPGSELTIYYNVIEGTLPNNTSPVYIHLGYDGWQNTDDYAMTVSGGAWWAYTFQIPEDVAVIDFVFTDLMGNWDNNGGVGIDWHIGLNYSWTPLNPNPNDVIHIHIRNSDMTGSIIWYIISGDFTQAPVEAYWPEGSYLVNNNTALETHFMGPDENGDYYVEIGPLTDGSQVVDEVKFQIWWENGTTQGSLFEIELDHTPQAGDPQLAITAPVSGAQIEGPTNIEVTAINSARVDFWVNGSYLGMDDTAPYEMLWNPDLAQFGTQTITARGGNESGRYTFQRKYVSVVPNVEHLPVPDGMDDGVNINGHEVTFVLYAPAKNIVALKGDFNPDYPYGEVMKCSGDTLWWLTKTLSDGQYHYQYNIDGIKLIADPWSTDVHWKDPSGNWESGDYQLAKTRFEVGAEPFEWTDEDFVRPPMDNLVVYEMHISDFVGHTDGTIGTYLEVLDIVESGYFDTLGVNVVEFMPVNEFEGENSWGYNPSFYMAPETAYGTPDELRMLINAFHERGIAVLLDVVFNHLWGSAPLFQLYQPLGNYNYQDHDYTHCPYMHNQESQWGYKLEHWHESGGRHYRAWKYVADALRIWVEDYHFDGFRYDHTAGIGWDGYNHNGMSYYSWFVDELSPTIIQIAEEDNAGQINATETDAGWNYSYYHAMKANLQEVTDGSFTWGHMYALSGEVSNAAFSDSYGPVNYTESHDETRVIYEAMEYQGMDRPTAIKKSKLGVAFLMCSRGTPMLYMGQEFGQDGVSRVGDGIVPQPLKWHYLDTAEGQDILDYYMKFIRLRLNSGDVLTDGTVEFKLRDSTLKTMVFWRLGSTDEVIVAANFNDQDATIDVEFPYSGEWHEITRTQTIEVADAVLTDYTLPAATARVFVSNPDWLNIEDDTPPVAALNVNLGPNFPNPFDTRNGSTSISYQLPTTAPVRLSVYNISGQLVKTLVDGNQDSGLHNASWDGRNEIGQLVSSGVYLYQLSTPSLNLTRQMVLLR